MQAPLDPAATPAHVLLDAHGFAALPTLIDRVDLVNRLCGRRAYSHHLSQAWADWLAHHPEAPAATQQTLVRELLLLSPNQERADDLYEALTRPWDRLPQADEPVFMVTSCQKYLGTARRLQAALRAQGALAWIVTGDPGLALPAWNDEGVAVAAPDTYEGLPLKVAQGVAALVHRYGPCTVVKIDDDCALAPDFAVEMFRRIGQGLDYAGLAVNVPTLDRLWHHGKTSRPMGLYTRRYRGPWAQGACYLLGARASALVAREVTLTPGELEGEYYEDKAIGDFLRGQGVALAPLPDHATWGIVVDLDERPATPDGLKAELPPSAAAAQPTPAPTLAPLPAPTPEPLPMPSAATLDRTRIPKVLHIIWVGDESKRPDNCIQTWVDHNPGWTINVWGNADLETTEWTNARHMRALWNRELNGVADLMRWEILYHHGGVVVDADSVCVRPLDDWLLEGEAVACWENEIARPRLIACGMVGSVPNNPFFGQIIQDLAAQDSLTHDMAWKTVGPLCLTTAYFKYQYTGLTILPSHFFIPDHFSGVHYSGGGIVYARQEWASTHHAYDTLHLKKVA